MDQLQTRLDALEQQVHTVTRRLRWWRGLACGLAVLAGLTWTLVSSKAVDAQSETLAHRLAALQDTLETLEGILRHVRVVTTPDGLKEVVITRANLRVVNGLGSTSCTDDQNQPIPDCPNGVGNLIVGYNERREEELFGENIRTGSHNIVVGQRHNFSRFGGVVVGDLNTISGDFAAVSGGDGNDATGERSSVSGGSFNRASGFRSSVSGGCCHTASGQDASVSGGIDNTASGDFAAVSGGGGNMAAGVIASVSGGSGNTASGERSTVSGGQNRTAEGEFDWVAGSLGEDE
jgi:hypothetical protein